MPQIGSCQARNPSRGQVRLTGLWLCVLTLSVSGATTQAATFAAGVSQGALNSSAIVEASGLVASRRNPGVLWTHNDSGSAALYAIATNGVSLARWEPAQLYGGDFEDLALGPGPRPDVDYLYLGDIGDNFASRLGITVLRAPEPGVYLYSSNAPVSGILGETVQIALEYPDGPFDAEALMSDPVTGDIFILTKNTAVASARLYRAPKLELDAGGPIVLEFQRTVGFRAVSAGDISVDGSEIVLRRGSHAELWKRPSGWTISRAFDTASTGVPLIGNPDEPNGEAIAFHPSGLGYYTLSEGPMEPVYFFTRTSSDAPEQPLTLLPPGSVWNFYDREQPPPVGWTQPAFDDGSWKSGVGKLGYGRPDVATQVDFGPDPDFKVLTTCFRKAFRIGNPLAYTNITLQFLFNDGLALYLNGVEIDRRHLAPNAGFYDMATADQAAYELSWVSLPVAASAFRPGTNVLAVELHRYNSYSPSQSFDLQIDARPGTTHVQIAGPPNQIDDHWCIPVVGPLGAVVQMTGSSDLTNWTTLGTLTLPDGYGVYSDPVVERGAQWFYRAQLF